jgi:hypothetical protein
MGGNDRKEGVENGLGTSGFGHCVAGGSAVFRNGKMNPAGLAAEDLLHANFSSPSPSFFLLFFVYWFLV